MIVELSPNAARVRYIALVCRVMPIRQVEVRFAVLVVVLSLRVFGGVHGVKSILIRIRDFHNPRSSVTIELLAR